MALVQSAPATYASSPKTESHALPFSFPTYIASPLAWTGNGLADARYIYHLTAEDLTEIRSALEEFKSFGLNGDLATPANFALPNLGTKLQHISASLYSGLGVFLIRGLTPEMYSVEDSTVVWMGIQGYIAGMKGRQDDQGNMIVHITPSPYEKEKNHARHSMDSLPFHTEANGDILAWQTRATAADGGKCILSSVYTAYNVLAAAHPEVIRTLAKPDWPFAFPTLHYRPILYYTSSNLIINFSPSALLGTVAHPRSRDLPSLNSSQIHALTALQTVARATELDITTQPGDLHFVNNLAIMHRRSAFSAPSTTMEDDRREDEDAEPKRHLVRMRLRDQEKGWEIPKELETEWNEAFGEEGEKEWHLFPMPEGVFPLRKYPE